MPTKISSLTDGVTMNPGDLFPVARGGTNVYIKTEYVSSYINAQPADDNLTQLAGLNPVDNAIVIGNNLNEWTLETGATARSSLGLGIGTDVQAYDVKLTNFAAIPSNGLIVKSGGTTYTSRSLQGANGVTVANTDGVSGNPTITLGGSDADFNGYEVGNATLKRLYWKMLSATVNTAYQMDFNNANAYELTLNGNLQLGIMNAPPSGNMGYVFAYIIQDAVGGRVLTYDTNIKFSGGVAPVISTVANAVNLLTFFTRNNGMTWDCSPFAIALA